jgi:hypothetical protein
MTWVEHTACACKIRRYKRLITKQEVERRLKQADNIKSDIKEIGCENVVCLTDFDVESIVGILCKI